MNILDLIMNKPIEKLTTKDLQRLHRAGYIAIRKFRDFNCFDENSEGIEYFICYPDKYNCGKTKLNYLEHIYTTVVYDNPLDIIKIGKSDIVHGLMRLSEYKPASINELIIRLQQKCK